MSMKAGTIDISTGYKSDFKIEHGLNRIPDVIAIKGCDGSSPWLGYGVNEITNQIIGYSNVDMTMPALKVLEFHEDYVRVDISEVKGNEAMVMFATLYR